jgi:hypothetical protein
MRFRFIASMLVIFFTMGPFLAEAKRYPLVAVDEIVPKPQLLSPRSGEVDLTGQDFLEFKWSPHEGNLTSRDYYDFRLYKGYDFLESALIFKQKVPPDIYVVRLRADMFTTGQVYTWSVRQVYTNGNKSHRSFQSFRVIKK